jgi:hypothetical protein
LIAAVLETTQKELSEHEARFAGAGLSSSAKPRVNTLPTARMNSSSVIETSNCARSGIVSAPPQAGKRRPVFQPSRRNAERAASNLAPRVLLG